MTTAATRWTTFLAIPFVSMFEAAGYYGMRSVLTLHALDGGLDRGDALTRMTAMSLAMLAATILAALVAIGTGPWIPIVLGALLATLGMCALALFPPELMLVPAVLVAFGHGFARPAIYGAAAHAFRDERRHLRDAAFFVLWGSANLAAILTMTFPMEVREAYGTRTVFFVAAVLTSVAILAAIGGAIVSFVSRPKPPEKIPFRGGKVGAAFAVAGLGALTWAAYGPITNVLYEAVYRITRDRESSGLAMLDVLNPLIVAGLALLFAIVFGVLHLTRVRVPTLAIAAIGTFVIGIAGILTLTTTEAPTEGGLGLAIAVLSLGEVLFAPLVISRATGDLPLRLETGAAALWIVGGQVPSVLLMMMAYSEMVPEWRRGLAWAGVVLTFLVAIALGVAALLLRRVFAPEAEAPKQPEEAREA